MLRDALRRGRQRNGSLARLALALLAAAAAGAAGSLSSGSRDAGALFAHAFELAEPAEVIATIVAGCAGCSWDAPGREAAALVLEIDGRYSQHLFLVRGESPVEYRVLLGALDRGTHRLRIARDPSLSAAGAGPVAIVRVETTAVGRGDARYAALAFAPIVHIRPNTIGRFSDVPLLMWSEASRTDRGTAHRYSIIFSHEDGGTPTDRLMATWGRATDIEFVYGIELDDRGAVLDERYQGPGHEELPFDGAREASHPLLWVVTDNNMFGDRGETRVRFAPAPLPYGIDPSEVSREIVMDDHPWTYAVMAQELAREGLIAAEAEVGSGRIPDPRRFVYLEACAELHDAALALGVVVDDGDGGLAWRWSDGGLPAFRIRRSGCFRAAVALPAGAAGQAPAALRIRAFPRPVREEETDPPAGGRARVRRVNRVFLLDDAYAPRPGVFSWIGDETIQAGGAPLELQISGPAVTARR